MGVIDKGPYRGTRFAKRQIACSSDNLRLRCGKCSGMDFEIHVQPSKSGQVARVKDVICLGCLKIRKVGDNGIIDSLGKVDIPKLTDDYVAPPASDIRAEEVRKYNGGC